MLVAYIVVVVVDRTYDDQYPCKLPVQARFGEHAKGHFFWASRAASRCQTGEAQKNCPAEAGLISTDKPTTTAIVETGGEQFPELLAQRTEAVLQFALSSVIFYGRLPLRQTKRLTTKIK
jgi:hypothetical protein